MNSTGKGMPMMDEKTKRFAANSMFPSLIFGALGLILAQAGVAQLGGSWPTYVILGIPGLTLSGLALYRARLHWSAGMAGMPGGAGGRRPPFRIRDLGWYLLLFGTGIVVAGSASSVVLLSIVASLSYLVPWARIPVCRNRFVASSSVTLAGAIVCLVFYGKSVAPLHYLIAAWMFTVASMMMTFLVVASLPYGYRVRESAQATDPSLDMDLPLPQ
jgi:hypothetical protein